MNKKPKHTCPICKDEGYFYQYSIAEPGDKIKFSTCYSNPCICTINKHIISLHPILSTLPDVTLNDYKVNNKHMSKKRVIFAGPYRTYLMFVKLNMLSTYGGNLISRVISSYEYVEEFFMPKNEGDRTSILDSDTIDNLYAYLPTDGISRPSTSDVLLEMVRRRTYQNMHLWLQESTGEPKSVIIGFDAFEKFFIRVNNNDLKFDNYTESGDDKYLAKCTQDINNKLANW